MHLGKPADSGLRSDSASQYRSIRFGESLSNGALFAFDRDHPGIAATLHALGILAAGLRYPAQGLQYFAQCTQCAAMSG